MKKLIKSMAMMFAITVCSVNSFGEAPGLISSIVSHLGNSNVTVYSSGIKIGGTTYDKTSEVVVIPSDYTVINIPNDNLDYYGAGVFPTGHNMQFNAFAIGQYEVTQELYEAVMGKNPSQCTASSKECGNILSGETQKLRPVDSVSWYDAVAFCNALTKKVMSKDDCVYYIDESFSTVYESGTSVYMDTTKKGYRLPTEAEWEFAARGGDTNASDWLYAYAGASTYKREGKSFEIEPYSDGNLSVVGWYWYNLSGIDGIGLDGEGAAGLGSHEVGLKKANRLGIYDMSGNVFEWCYDWYNDEPTSNSNASGSYRVKRGGSWNNNSYYCSVFARYNNNPSSAYYNLGFRLARSL